MATSFTETDFVAGALSPVNVGAVFAWLDSPPAPDAHDDLSALHDYLTDLRRSKATSEQRILALERLYARSVPGVATLCASLAGVSLPLHRRTRQLVRDLQTLLRTLAEDLQACLERHEESLLRAHGLPPEQMLWRIVHSLAQHLLISHLAASSAGIGIWKHLHQCFEQARGLGVLAYTPPDGGDSVQRIYYAAALLGCAQPSSFTALEIGFINTWLTRFVDQIDEAEEFASGAIFWIDPERDAAAVACSRKPVPPLTPVRRFSCDRLGALLKAQLGALEGGLTPKDMPEFAATSAGRGVLRRLASAWGEPGKRHFSRRRQNYRAALCAGLGSLWRLFDGGDDALTETSNWMVTNESPDGYAVMHVSGRAGNLAVGNIVAIRAESGAAWQICIVRWALSENQEHLELGLQLLASRAVAARLAVRDGTDSGLQLPVLVLPEIAPLHARERLVVPSGALERHVKKLVLVVEKDHLEIREIRSTGLDEQNSQIEMFAIETDPISTASL